MIDDDDDDNDDKDTFCQLLTVFDWYRGVK